MKIGGILFELIFLKKIFFFTQFWTPKIFNIKETKSPNKIFQNKRSNVKDGSVILPKRSNHKRISF